MRRFTLCVAVCLSVALAPAAYSQEVRASISGTVMDPTGAAVANATVTVTNPATNASVVAKTNDVGLYLTPFLAPGTYQLTVEAAGFTKYVQTGIKLQTLDKLRADVQLQIGEVTSSVTVEAAVATLQTETASRSQIISNEMIANIPTQGRNPFQIVWAAPGVVKSGGWRYLRSFDIGGTTGFAVNGGRNGQNEVLQDGISNVQSSQQVIHVPTMDSVAEFKILTNTYDAQYGRTGGGIITIVTKSGTNDLHGSVFEYFQNAKMNANQFELNAGRVARPPMHINQYGFEAGGPVFVPKVFNGKNRLFWLIAYEGLKQRSADPGLATFPIMDIRGGDFTNLFNGNGQQITIYDPLTTQPDGSRTAFSGNKIPSSRMNPVAVNALKYYPAPTSQGVGPNHFQNYPYPSRWVGNLAQWIGRVDLAINSKNNFYFRYGENPWEEFRSLVFVSDISQVNPAEPTGNAPLIRNGRTWNFDWTSTLSPRMTFDLRAGLSRWEETTGSNFGTGFDPAQLGMDPNLTKQFTRVGFPMFTFSSDSYQNFGPSRLTSYNVNEVYTVQPNLNLVVGHHFLKFGAEGRKYNDFSLNPGVAGGGFDFNKTWTQANSKAADAVSGNALASFLLGDPASAYLDRNIDPAWTHFYYSGFFQDDWKATSRLTVNLGLRWDVERPITERYDRMVKGLDLNAASPIASKVQGLSLKGQVLFANLNGQSRGSYNPDMNNFAPRIGLAYRLGSKWVLRGGYGLYYLAMWYPGNNQGFSQRTSATISTDGLTPAVNLTNPFVLLPGGQLLSAVGSAQGAGSFLGQSPSGVYQDTRAP
ncbi:MAG: carboxypeptidase regulatory-like domain-containing protein [Bryobacteraceae bacterium]